MREQDTERLTITVSEYAKLTGFADSTIYAAVERGELDEYVIRVGRAIRLAKRILAKAREAA